MQEATDIKLQYMSEVSQKDSVRNDDIRLSLGVEDIRGKMGEHQLWWIIGPCYQWDKGLSWES